MSPQIYEITKKNDIRKRKRESYCASLPWKLKPFMRLLLQNSNVVQRESGTTGRKWLLVLNTANTSTNDAID